MLQTFRERLTLVLIGLLPVHALLVTVVTKLIAGPDQAPLSWLALWKEGLLGLILLIGFVEIINRSRKPKASRLKLDRIDWIIVALLLLSIATTLMGHGDWKLYLFGFKYDFVPLVAFMLLRRVEWSETWWKQVQRVIFGVAAVVGLYGLVSLLLPAGFFRALGYSDLHSLYLPGEPLAPFQQIGGSSLRRMQSAMSGPNQLGIWMLLPFAMVLVALLRRFSIKKVLFRMVLEKLHVISKTIPWKQILLFLLIGFVILLTFSRASWIAAFIVLLVAIWQIVPSSIARKLIASIFLWGVICGVGILLIAPSVVVRLSSSRGHIERPMDAIRTMIAEPFGRGLGTAGPASHRNSDACIELDAGSDASWAADRPDMCVFVGDEQVQPLDRVCNCAFLPENWYLQIGVEMGVLGFLLFIALTFLVIHRMREKPEVILAFLGVSIAALFLHAWEDAAVAYSVWMLTAAALAPRREGVRLRR